MSVLDLCRVTVKTDRTCGSVAVDLALPTRAELGEFFRASSISSVAERRPTMASPRDRTLSRLDGSMLDESVTLHENGVQNGDVLLLTTARTQITEAALRRLVPVRRRSLHRPRLTVTTRWPRCMGAAACLWSTGFGATMLAWPGPAAPSTRAIIAAIVAVAATVGGNHRESHRCRAAADFDTGHDRCGIRLRSPASWWCPAARHRRTSFWRRRSAQPCRRCCFMSRPAERPASRRSRRSRRWRRSPRRSWLFGQHRRKQWARCWPPHHSPCWVWRPSCRSSWRVCPRRCPARRTGRSDDSLPADVRASRAVRGHETLTGLLAGFSVSRRWVQFWSRRTNAMSVP